ncbi:zinc ribbon domain-containing protein [Desulfonatronospira sp.]|uniref:FmdB family zinc ribbon protein n=1 Tax=Desulfonatronospira sp. TaxID=1962951 RepID=UPI0025BEFFB7|nr:zinc ribbon domain-containing protein [Desulfonatronospira sp.]
MPIYEYRCNECHQLFEEWQKDFQERDVNCPICGGGSSRLISNSAFVLKGSGWYTTDYCKNRIEAGNGNGKSTTNTEAAKNDSTSSTGSETSTQTTQETTSS